MSVFYMLLIFVSFSLYTEIYKRIGTVGELDGVDVGSDVVGYEVVGCAVVGVADVGSDVVGDADVGCAVVGVADVGSDVLGDKEGVELGCAVFGDKDGVLDGSDVVGVPVGDAVVGITGVGLNVGDFVG